MLELIRNLDNGSKQPVRDFIKYNSHKFIRIEHLTPIINDIRENPRMLNVFSDLRTDMRLKFGAPDYTFTLSHRYSYWGFSYLRHRVFVACSIRGTTFEMLSYEFEKAPASVIVEFIKEFYREMVAV